VSEELAGKYSYDLKSYYMNGSSEDRYIELNPETNQWRYCGSVTSGLTSKYWGSNKNGTVRYYESGKNADGEIVYEPDRMWVYSITDIGYPVSFDGNADWKDRYLKDYYLSKDTDSTTISVSGSSNFTVLDSTGAVICNVVDGRTPGNENGVKFYPYVGITEDGESGSCGGQLVIPYTNFTIQYTGDDDGDITILGSENAVNIASGGAVEMAVSLDTGEVQLTSSEAGSDINFQISEVYSSDEYTSVEVAGTLDENDGIAIQLSSDDSLKIESNIESNSELVVYADHDKTEESLYVATLDSESEAQVDVLDLREYSVSLLGDYADNYTASLEKTTDSLVLTLSPKNSEETTLVLTDLTAYLAGYTSEGQLVNIIAASGKEAQDNGTVFDLRWPELGDVLRLFLIDKKTSPVIERKEVYRPENS
jgi:hypothetical protein